jgi:hypothetical protein
MEPPWKTIKRVTHHQIGLTALSGVTIQEGEDHMRFFFSAEAKGGGELGVGAGRDGTQFNYFAPGGEPADAVQYQVKQVIDATNTGDGDMTYRQQT